MWSPWSITARVFVMLPTLAVIVTAVVMVTALPADVSTDGMWQQRDGWPNVVPPAWPYWLSTVLAVVGLLIAGTWNRREVLRDSSMVGFGLVIGAIWMVLFGTRFQGLDAWPHSLVWAAAVLVAAAVVAFVASARVRHRGSDDDDDAAAAAATADDPVVR